jgi:hypothetical protein
MHELAERTAAALTTKPRSRRAASAEQVDEIRIVHTWIAAHDPPRLELGGEPPTESELSDWVRSVCPAAATGTETVTHNGGKSWESWTR